MADSWASLYSNLAHQFLLRDSQLETIARGMFSEMTKGANGAPSSIKMLPSYVSSRPKGTESGSYVALDMGGTNFRVVKCDLKNGKLENIKADKFVIPSALMTRPGDELFDFLADCIQKSLGGGSAEEARIGFTFSFPVDQLRIDAGRLLSWTKGFSSPGVEGQDVVALLRDSLQRKGVRGRVEALVNDTVGTLVARLFEDTTCVGGMICGTGCNIAIWEPVEAITKLSAQDKAGITEMIINTEWGNFDPECGILPVSIFDVIVDRASPNVGKQRFEKMISGFYMGELLRLMLVQAMDFRAFPETPVLRMRESVTAFHVTVFSNDSPTLERAISILKKEWGVPGASHYLAHLTQQLAHLVVKRAARLVAAGIRCIVERVKHKGTCTVAVDGSVFEKDALFRSELSATVDRLLPKGPSVKLVLTQDGSGKGGALIAALASPSRTSKL
eukprot:NODE_983_length_1776_cov_88.488130_g868_i0.p1 GENE.NODE_983_length_1776_cov_88.488130_g868_i0~~NODE_983_length_1776_cov_88.488130_g868_i0.p1  ORF type:complete len:446 (-),score=86.09 NODE_983_length_1776_cov_88.488130_g868_i0:363-1700(-)